MKTNFGVFLPLLAHTQLWALDNALSMLRVASLKEKSPPIEANELQGAMRVADPQDPNDKAFVLVGIIYVSS